ncbi:MAG: hypothetical protein Q9227_005039 [Pyrenula ochraceoflavens]
MHFPLHALSTTLFAATLVQSFTDSTKRANPLVESYKKNQNSQFSAANERFQNARPQLIEYSDDALYPQQTFLTDKSRMNSAIGDSSSAAALAQDYSTNIPKGAHLHIHFNAVLPGEVVWDIAIINPTTKIKNPWVSFAPPADPPVDPLNKNAPSSQNDCQKDDNNLGPYYVCLIETSMMTIHDATWATGSLKFPLSDVSEKVGKLKGPNFVRDSYLHHQMYFPNWSQNPSDPYKSYNDITVRSQKNWIRFNKRGTEIWKTFFMYETVLEEYTKRLIQYGLDQGFIYQEWKTVFLTELPVIDRSNEKKGHRYYLDIMDRVIKAAKANTDFIGAKIIYCVSREFDFTVDAPKPASLGVQWQINNLIGDNGLLKVDKYRSLIVGFDILGHEDNPTFFTDDHYYDLVKKLLDFVKPSTNKIPFGLSLHAGESLDNSANSKAKSNLAFVAKMKKEYPQIRMRAGHGVLLKSNPAIMTQYDQLHIHVELCPLSNHFFGTNKNAQDFSTYGRPILDKLSCSYNGDDPTYQQSNAADEYMFAWSGNQNVDLYHHRAVGEMSIDAAFMTDDERAKALKIYNAQWDKLDFGASSCPAPVSGNGDL